VSLKHAAPGGLSPRDLAGTPSHACTHARTHACMHARNIHVRAHALSISRAYVRTPTSTHTRASTHAYEYVRHARYARARARTRTRTLSCYGALRSAVRTDEGKRVGETFEYKWPSFAVAHPNQPSREGESRFQITFLRRNTSATEQNGENADEERTRNTLLAGRLPSTMILVSTASIILTAERLFPSPF